MTSIKKNLEIRYRMCCVPDLITGLSIKHLSDSSLVE